MNEARSRALHGLVRHFRAAYRKRRRSYAILAGKVVWSETAGAPAGRDVVGAIWGASVPAGTCVWCRGETKAGAKPGSRRPRWHPRCADQYAAARGLTASLMKPNGLIPTGPCEGCGAAGTEIDHRLALSVGRALGYRWHIRAHRLENLRNLCRECHRAKTGHDRRTLRAVQVAKGLDAEVQALAEAPLLLADLRPPAQPSLFDPGNVSVTVSPGPLASALRRDPGLSGLRDALTEAAEYAVAAVRRGA